MKEKKKKGPAQVYLEKIRKLDVQINCMIEEQKQLEDMRERRICRREPGQAGQRRGQDRRQEKRNRTGR